MRLARKMVSERQMQRAKALCIAKSLGVKVAARYLAARGWSLEASRWILFRR